ncbi:MAG: hypothetical protein PHW62_05235 [Candidatus Ratteibacteria bacterium]|nr:hypothetical protein [Candidatus Ratteibacteria bacterium]
MSQSQKSHFEDAFIDSASIAQIVQAFQRGMMEADSWSWISLVELTSFLTFTNNIHIMGYSVPENTGLEASLLKELHRYNFIKPVQGQIEFDVANEAIIETFNYDVNVRKAHDHLVAISSNREHQNWRRWVRTNAWVLHARAGYGLFDKDYIPVLSKIICNGDNNELTKLWEKTTDIKYVQTISNINPTSINIKGAADVAIIDDAFMMAAKLRGLIYVLNNYSVSLHHFRRPFIDIFFPQAKFSNGTIKEIKAKLTDTERWTVVLLIAISLSLPPEEGAITWVKNMASVRKFIKQLEQEKKTSQLLEEQGNPEKTKKNAIKLVREKLEIKTIPDIFEKIDEKLKAFFPTIISIILKQIPEAEAIQPYSPAIAKVIVELKLTQKLSKKYYNSEKRLNKLVEKVNGRIESVLNKKAD